MNRYIQIRNNIVCEIIPDEISAFPNVPAKDRYTADFLASCILVTDDAAVVEQNYYYDPEKGTFTNPATNEAGYLDSQKAAKLAELNAAAETAIVAGCDVSLTEGTTGHITLTTEDQINLTTAQAAVQGGAPGYPYHLDGELCKVYPAADIVIMAKAAVAHILYHTTYCNHLRAWVQRVTTEDELAAITYGAALPDDLKVNMEAIISAASA